MSRKYRKERKTKSTNRTPHPPEIQQYLDSLDPQKLWEHCRPRVEYLEVLSPKEQSQAIRDSKIVVFELLAKRFGLGSLALRGDIIHPLELTLDYSDLQQSNPILESYSHNLN